MLLRGARAGGSVRRDGRGLTPPRRVPLDAAIVPGLLLLVARDLALFDPPRILAWRLLHDPRLATPPAWLTPFLPAPSGVLDRDPIALLLAGFATLLALAYAALAIVGARATLRAALIVLGALLLVVLPSAAFIGMGVATDRPYGQDGGVVQLPLALDLILAGESPYGADYSNTILAKQARVSSFWEERGGNPILHHHAYLPGTHLLMMPFHLASRAALGFFDPRFVTLIFYALVVVLVARLPQTDDGRLAAAGLAALNPLVYWHQIFGANDLLFVAILLAAVLAARGGRPILSGALLGLACATKQLAWPFAPFLLVALSGARRPRDLVAPEAWRRVASPLAAAAGVFVLVVLPIAARDLGAFWGDIVVYNVGLPGADNYPLGGTPGFGFANYLIYFGHVQSLRDHVSFTPFYLILAPLGLLLLRRQMREGTPEAVLVTGSVALVASIYVSRVVHPNYLVPAAVLLPVGVIARRLRADLALVPLLLLGLAVEFAENAILRTTWEQAVAANLPSRLGGLAATLVPRAGPGLTRDPLGLLVSATAAGLAILHLSVGVAGAGRRVRAGLVTAAVALAVAAPLLVMVRVGDRTGLFRAQDPRVVQAAADGRRLVNLRSPYTPPRADTPRGREAIATSFRFEPPVEHRPEHPLVPPGLSVLAGFGRLIGTRDIRIPALLALVLLAILASRRAPAEERPMLLALTLLPAPLALGTVLGSPLALVLAALVGASLLARSGQVRAAALAGGLAAGLDHWALLITPPLLFLLPTTGESRRRGWLLAGYAALGYAAVVLPVALLDVGAFGARLLSPARPGAGLGVFNVIAYSGGEAAPPAQVLAVLAPLAAALVVLGLLRRGGPPLAVAGLASVGWLALAPEISADAVAVPIVLLGLAAAEREGAGAPEGP